MELSINAIVILIIAMVVLGIGILFIRGMFAKSSEKLVTAISAQQVKKTANADEPLVADDEVIISTAKPVTTLGISIYNNAAVEADDLTIWIAPCISSLTGVNALENITFTPVVNGKVKGSEQSSYLTLVGMKKGRDNRAASYPFAAGDTLICTLSSESATVSELDLSTTVLIKVQAS